MARRVLCYNRRGYDARCTGERNAALMNRTKLTAGERGWIEYDIAASAFTMLISTTIPILFRGLADLNGMEPAQVTSLWGTATSVSVLVLALLSPLLGALADYKGMKKRMFLLFLLVGLAGLVGLAKVTDWVAYLGMFLIARIGYSACNIFYDSMLVDVTTDDRMDLVSSYGYALGYIGSCIPFAAGIFLILFDPMGMGTTGATQFSFLLTAVWWAVLSLPLLRRVRQVHFLEDRQDKLGHAFTRLGQTLRKIRKEKKLFFFILAYFCYIDGVYTIISMATVYGGEVGISDTSMILALLLTQVVAFPCAILSGKAAQRFGTLRVLRVFVAIYCGICLFGFGLDQAWEFWVLAVVVGMAQGGIQSLSRSYFGRLVPKEESNEYFGFFDIFGRFADFLGPLIVAFCAQLTGSSSYGILGLLVLFVVGFVLLGRVERLER